MLFRAVSSEGMAFPLWLTINLKPSQRRGYAAQPTKAPDMGVPAVGEEPMKPESLFEHDWPIEQAKAVLIAHLKTLGITSVSIGYDGEGDQGQISDIEALEPTEVKIKLMTNGTPLGAHRELTDALENFAWKVLDDHHAGFENNDGGFGTITIDVAANNVSLEKNDKFVDFHTETVAV